MVQGTERQRQRKTSSWRVCKLQN